MRVLLRDKESHLYYQEGDVWTENARDAFDFQYSAGLPKYHEMLDRENAELVVLAPTEPTRKT